MASKKSMSLLEIILVVFPLTNILGIDRFVMGDMKWGLIRLVLAFVGGIGFILWIVDLVFLLLGKYNTDMLKYLK